MTQSIDALIKQLADPEACESAIAGLVACRECAVFKLARALHHRLPRVRQHAITALGRIGGKAAARVLYEAMVQPPLWENSPWYYVRVLRAMVEVGPPAVGPLCRLLHEVSHEYCASVVEALETLGDARAAGPLLALLSKSQDDVLNGRIIRALARFPEPGMTDVFAAALITGDREVRERAAAALRALGWEPGNAQERVLYQLAGDDYSHLEELDEEAVPVLCELLRAPLARQRARAAECMGFIGRSEALPALRERQRLLVELHADVALSVKVAIRMIERATRETARRPRAGDGVTLPTLRRPRAGEESPDGTARPRAE